MTWSTVYLSRKIASKLKRHTPRFIRRSKFASSIVRALNRAWSNSAYYKNNLNSETDKLTSQVLTGALKNSGEYRQYIHAQISKSLKYQTRDLVDQPQRTRSLHDFAERLNKILPRDRQSLSVLCVGCRNNHEIDYLQGACGFGEAVGLDLFSVDPRIEVGDMHKMPFADDRFDVLYSCHSLEHSYDIGLALREFTRVVKPTGILVIEVPINYNLSATDRWDVKSARAFLERFPVPLSQIFLSENKVGREKQSARTIVRIAKPVREASTTLS